MDLPGDEGFDWEPEHLNFMNENISSYPLKWPLGYERTPRAERKRAMFGTTGRSAWGGNSKQKRSLTIAEGVERLMQAIRAFTKSGKPWRIDPDRTVISSMLRARMDGLPMSNQSEPEDTGIAVYFELDGKLTVMCCDKWDRTADNLGSIAATLEAMRALERYGVSQSERAFTGFMALPAPGEVQARTCWEVLGIASTKSKKTIDDAWRERTKICHPDRPGGSHDAMAELNTARDQAAQQATEA